MELTMSNLRTQAHSTIITKHNLSCWEMQQWGFKKRGRWRQRRETSKHTNHKTISSNKIYYP